MLKLPNLLRALLYGVQSTGYYYCLLVLAYSKLYRVEYEDFSCLPTLESGIITPYLLPLLRREVATADYDIY